MTAPPGETAERERLSDLRRAFNEILGAERRLRGREKSTDAVLTVAQVRALLILAIQERATAGEMARHADLNPASMTAMLDQLEASGIVTRERNDDDRRVVVVELTPLGRELMQAAREAWESAWDRNLGDLSDAEIETAVQVMRRIVVMLDELRARWEPEEA